MSSFMKIICVDRIEVFPFKASFRRLRKVLPTTSALSAPQRQKEPHIFLSWLLFTVLNLLLRAKLSFLSFISTASSVLYQMSLCMRKPTICIGVNNSQISFEVTAKLISAFVFATRTVQSLFYLNTKIQASNNLL